MTAKTITAPAAVVPQGNLLNPAVRRDIADLNRLFLGRALDPAFRDDPWFCLPAAAIDRLAVAPAEALERAAQSPVALFEIRLPMPETQDQRQDSGVADATGAEFLERSRIESRRAFGLAALGVLRRLGEGMPLSPRIAFGLDAGIETRLAALSLSESFEVAAWPGLVRPRWPGHERYWRVLADAVMCDDGVHWAYATGLCLLGQCERQAALVAYSARRQPRPAHRRPAVRGANGSRSG